jgi:Flp pilus assembly protein TadD
MSPAPEPFRGPPGGGQGPLGIDRRLRKQLDTLGDEFLAEILGRETERHPQNFEALTDLAHCLTRLGRLQEGLAVDRRLVELAPADPTVHYNLACSLALLGERAAALDALEQALACGYDDLEQLLVDEDLSALRAEQRFHAIAARLREA